MKSKLYQTENIWQYSAFGKNAGNIFALETLVFGLTYEIYNKKSSKRVNHKDFIKDFFSSNPNIVLPYYINTKITVTAPKGVKKDLINPKNTNVFDLLSERIISKTSIESESSLIILTGASGSGKSTAIQGIAHQTLFGKLKEEHYMPIYLTIDFDNTENSLKIIKNGTNFDFYDKNIDSFLNYSFPILFFIDTALVTEGRIRRRVSLQELNEIIEKLENK
ncbi:MAG: ATP-binding protein, partial [Cyanobacteriota bacterium]